MENNKCIRCGLCQRVCIGAIELTENGPVIDTEKCYRCGHCVAVCPVDAIENPLSARQEEILPLPSPKEAANYLRSVRSIREYKNEAIPEEKICELLDIGRYPQTGKNTQGIGYRVLCGREKVEKLLELFIEEGIRIGKEDPAFRGMAAVSWACRRRKQDIVFRGAPYLIAAIADENNPRARESGQFALTFISLLAPTMGLGTCWAGFFEDLALSETYSAPFREFLNVPEGKKIAGVLMLGVPDVSYRRLVERDPLDCELL
ncbi:MAG: nitroreductase family protein [Christensenellaceae bacterium]|nr:nitroreductase family protein [Christensenellaceae bacterium]